MYFSIMLKIVLPKYFCCDVTPLTIMMCIYVTPRSSGAPGADLDNVLQCSMRMSARSNPPTSSQYALAPPGPAKCLDISTVR